jgi:hypothetical protein
MPPIVITVVEYAGLLLALMYAYVYGRRHGARVHKLSASLPATPSKDSLRVWEALSAPMPGNNDTINIYVRRGGHKLPIGSVRITDIEFEKNLLDFMADAESKAGIMNSSLVKWDGDVAEESEIKRLKEKIESVKDKASMWENRYNLEKHTNGMLYGRSGGQY